MNHIGVDKPMINGTVYENLDLKFRYAEKILEQNGYKSITPLCGGELACFFKCSNKNNDIVIVSVVMDYNKEDFGKKIEKLKLIRRGIDFFKFDQKNLEQSEISDWIQKNADFCEPIVKIVFGNELIAILEFFPVPVSSKESKSREKIFEAKKFVELNGYTVKSFLGRGKFSIVLKCINPEGSFVATKVVVVDSPKTLEREVKASESISSMKMIYPLGYNRPGNIEGIAKKHQVTYDRYFNIPRVKLVSEEQNMAIIESPLMEGDVLNKFSNILADEVSAINYQEIRKIVITVLNVLRVLHSQGKIHFDIKPQNILVNAIKCGNKIYQVADFGLVSSIENFNAHIKTRENYCKDQNNGLQSCRDSKKKRGRGTRAYMAPELLEGKQLEDELALKVDIYSLGATIFKLYLLGRSYPVAVKNKAMKEGLKKLHSDSNFDQLLQDDEQEKLFLDFVKCLTDNLPQNRPSIEQVIEHPFISYRS